MRYIAEYQCRLCGEIFRTGKETEEKRRAVRAIQEMANGALYTHAIGAISITAPHGCNDGSVGVSDLIGFVQEGDEEEEDQN